MAIEVSDDGPGIAQSLLSEIGKRGVRADQLTPGHGVGLAIVQDIVQTYNGQINFSSDKESVRGLVIHIQFKLH
ncbi:ATP-binding protein [sulfur-oxidizing endosymbiont of Gigantopelta aegis]|uniref:ATP-binding protein n=1 Tax=sulfur-oxidizing endosymbiont of Gigantopelta aegis TaxID=2794934 RepID=UPI0018DEAC11|nr:ATP-binding protein [sulfur-oxidizing endosymbiont of Gigantopelta aegis]